MNMNKKLCILSCLLSFVLVAVLLISFTNCVYVVHHPSWSAWSPDAFDAERSTSFYTNYSPLWVSIFTVIQLILLWIFRKPFVCWFGIVLNIVGTLFPGFRMILSALTGKMLKDAFYDYTPSYDEYTFKTPFYLIIILSIAITTLYIILFIFRRKAKAGLIAIQANASPVNGMNAYPSSGETEKLITGENSCPVIEEDGNKGSLN